MQVLFLRLLLRFRLMLPLLIPPTAAADDGAAGRKIVSSLLLLLLLLPILWLGEVVRERGLD